MTEQERLLCTKYNTMELEAVKEHDTIKALTAVQKLLEEVINPESARMVKGILDCWDLLKPRPSSIAPLKPYPNIYNQELLNNQEELIKQLTAIIEPLVEEIENEDTI